MASPRRASVDASTRERSSGSTRERSSGSTRERSSGSTRERDARKERRRTRWRSEIVDAASTVLTRDGIAALTVDAVAREAQVSKPAVYYYFRSKEDLVRE